ncbi:MAG: PIN domain-containing protein [Verrucomicrobia bacterium]|nr:PIN domain-containing protein [Verrucomicrobiota bacterium]
MAILIDSSVLIAFERGKLDLPAWLATCPGSDATISVITLIELYHGLYRATTEAISHRRASFIQQCLRDYFVLPLDQPMAETAGNLRADLEKRGLGIGPHDLLIAATAVSGGHSVATANVREFNRIPGLTVLCWQGPPPSAPSTPLTAE